MYIKLALKNVKKSYKDFFVYFITLTVSVSLFYLFNSFDAQQSIIVSDSSTVFAFGTLQMVMKVISIFVTVIFGFLILYANNFLLKRRKKEIALYTLLGMKKSKISKIVVYETLIVGLVSLFSGISLGIILSQGSAAFAANLVKAEIEYTFIISNSAIYFTVVNFSIIFVIVAFFSNIKISRTKLIELFKAHRSNEEIKIKNPLIMILIMIISISVLLATYRFVMEPFNLIMFLLPVLIIGSLCTFGLFYTMSYWMVFFVSKAKGYYYKDLNTFTIRQISSKINSTYKMLAVVSLFMLVSFGALATAFNINSIITEVIEVSTPYDLSITINHYKDTNISEIISELDISDYNPDIVKLISTNVRTESLKESDFIDYSNSLLFDYDLMISLLNIEDYNKIRLKNNQEKVLLDDNEVIYFTPDYYTTDKERVKLFNNDITLFDSIYKIKDSTEDYNILLGNNNQVNDLIFVMNENTLNNVIFDQPIQTKYPLIDETTINLSLNENDDVDLITNQILKDLNSLDPNNESLLRIESVNSNEIENLFSEVTLLITYLGLYLGLTFLVVCVMVIALQLLSEANDNYERYLLLDKIGVSEKLQRRSIFKQNLIYFLLPIIVGLIHSYFGLKSVNLNLSLGGMRTTNYTASIVSIFVLCLIYLIYFLVTYYSSLQMTLTRKHINK